jgi:myo-inositol-1(or 4)-monophosphatase
MSHTSTIDTAELLDIAIAAARQAGQLIHEKIGSDLQIRAKDVGTMNLVTIMDHASEDLIKEIISSRHGGAVFLAEESGGNRDLGPLTWVVDPIDGTVNYAHGIPLYCVSIAAVMNNEPVVGVIYDPNRNELFSATKGGGAHLNGEPIKVSSTPALNQAVLVTGFPYHVAENPFGCIDAFVDFLKLGVPVRRLGSAALDIAYVASGRFDGFWEVVLNEWDVAAGLLMLQEAGGRITSYDPGYTFDAESKSCPLVVDRLLATNGLIHDEMKRVLARM